MAELVFTSVLPRPNLERVFVVCGGPSLKGRNLTRLREQGYVLGVNKAALTLNCHGAFTMDRTLYNEWLRDGTIGDWLALRSMEIFVLAPAHGEDWPYLEMIDYLERVQGYGYNECPWQLHNGLNSGWAATHLSLHMRPKEVVILGLDLLPVTADEPLHWWDRDATAPRQGMTYYQCWADRFMELELTKPEGVRIVNANPESAVRCFPFTSYEEYGL